MIWVIEALFAMSTIKWQLSQECETYYCRFWHRALCRKLALCGPSFQSCSCIVQEGTCSLLACNGGKIRIPWRLSPHRLRSGVIKISVPGNDDRESSFWLMNLVWQRIVFLLKVFRLLIYCDAYQASLQLHYSNDDIEHVQFSLARQYRILMMRQIYYLSKRWSSS